MPHPYPFHNYTIAQPMAKGRYPGYYHQKRVHQPVVRMQFIAALIWTLCIYVASVV